MYYIMVVKLSNLSETGTETEREQISCHLYLNVPLARVPAWDHVHWMHATHGMMIRTFLVIITFMKRVKSALWKNGSP